MFLARRLLALDGVLAELESFVQRFDRAGTWSAATTQEILIGEVEIISMLMPSSPRT